MKTVLMISPEPWNAQAVSKHHYATTLAEQGIRVLFLEPPTQEPRALVPISGHPNVFVLRMPVVLRGLRFLPGMLRRFLERRWLQDIEKWLGVYVDCIWLFENSRFFDMRFAGNRIKVYHQVDLNQEFHLEAAASTADICFCTTEFIRERLVRHNAHVHKIHHGVAVHQHPAPLDPQQELLFTNGGVHAAYVGNLDMEYIDVDLLAEVATRFPCVTFHMVGGYSRSGALYARIGELMNVHWWGSVPSPQVPAILARTDVLLLTYRADVFKEQLASPHKVMEYLASGKVVVATYTDEYRVHSELLEMVVDRAHYAAKFREVVENLGKFNSPPRTQARRAFASDHAYSRQLQRIFEAMAKSGLPVDIASAGCGAETYNLQKAGISLADREQAR